MPGLVEVVRRVLVFGAIAATDVAADQTQTEVHPAISESQAFLAPFCARRDVANLADVLAAHRT